MKYMEDLFKILGIVIVIAFILFIVVKSLNLQTKMVEGLTSQGTTQNDPIAAYASSLQNEINRFKSRIDIKKERKNLEQLIMNADELINYAMLEFLI